MSNEKSNFVFERENYILMIIGLVVLLIGFFLMSGGGSDDPNVYTKEIFSARRITVAPTVCLIGYGVIMWSIFKRPKSDESPSAE